MSNTYVCIVCRRVFSSDEPLCECGGEARLLNKLTTDPGERNFQLTGDGFTTQPEDDNGD